MENNEFKIQPSDKPKYWIVAHKDSGIIVEFEEKNFNKSQKVLDLEEKTEVKDLPKILGEIGNWLSINHAEKL